jgi:hypothetical protein
MQKWTDYSLVAGLAQTTAILYQIRFRMLFNNVSDSTQVQLEPGIFNTGGFHRIAW